MATAAVQQPVAAPGAVGTDEPSTSRRDTRQRIHDLEILAQTPEVLWVRKQMKMIRGDWAWSTAHAHIAVGFLQSTTNGRLFAYRDENSMLQISTTFPQKWEEVLIFLREPGEPVNAKNIDKMIQCTLLKGCPSDSMLRVLQCIYIPYMLETEAAQISVTKDFKEDLDKFMATLTESIYEAQGQTLLYIPPLEFKGTIKEQARDKELTQRLEQIINRWTRQIKEVVRNQEEASGDDEETGPLAEIDFWRRRSRNLSGIHAQIQQPELRQCLAVLERFRSSYLGPFLDLSQQIEQEASIAEENLKYLTVLEGPCEELSKCSIRDIPLLYPKILRCIRMIWKLSPFYSTTEKITNLLCLVSNEIIRRCAAGIPLREVFDGDEESCRVALKESIHANEAWKRVYSTMVEQSLHVPPVYVDDSISPSQTSPVLKSPTSPSSPSTNPGSPTGEEKKHHKKHHDKDKRKVSDWNNKIIFAPVEAFLQRCRDMLEVCDAQSQFSSKLKLPAFAGARGPEITKSLVDSQDTFKKLVAELRSLSYNLLDVKVTRWHYDYHKFKAGVVDLEIMMQNVMMMAFKHAASLSESIELLEAFKLMACRTSICACVERMTTTVFTAFMGELTMMKRQFDLLRRRPLMDYSFPRYAGGAIWALHFQHRLTKPMSLLVHATPYLLESVQGPDLGQQYNLIIASIEQYVQSQYAEWTQTVDPYLERKLQTTLLEDAGEDVVQLHSEANVLALFQEVHYWSSLGFQIPIVATVFLQKHHDYRHVFNDVFRMARDHNKLLGTMDLVMRGLVTDRVVRLSQSIQPGIDKVTWLSPREEIYTYLHDVHMNCLVVEATIMQIDGSNKKITGICVEISAGYLINLEKKKLYEISEFDQKQVEHRAQMRAKLERAYANIKETIAISYEKCSSDLEEVRIAWDEYRRRVEIEMENALRNSVIQSLAELAKVVSPEAKNLNPLFKTLALLDKASNHVKLLPSLQDFMDIVQTVAKELITVITVVPRLRERSPLTLFVQGAKDKSSSSSGKDKTSSSSTHSRGKAPQMKPPPTTASSTTSSSHESTSKSTPLTGSTPSSQKTIPTFYEVIAPEQDQMLNVITSSIMSINDKVQAFLSSWEKKFKSIWDQDKDAFIRRYERAKKPLSSFDSDIIKYKDYIEDVQAEETITNLRFLRIECGILKHTITEHCEAWILKFTTLLHQLAKTELDSIYTYFAKNREDCNRQPNNLGELTETATLWRSVCDECDQTESRFDPLNDKYRVLNKFEVPLSEEEKNMLEMIPRAWEEFKQMLAEVELKLENAKNNFRDTLQDMVESFVREDGSCQSRNSPTLTLHLILRCTSVPAESGQKDAILLSANDLASPIARQLDASNDSTKKEGPTNEHVENQVADTRQSFVERMPMEASIPTPEALQFIAEERVKVESFQKRGVELWAGMALFGMERLSNKENIQTLKELDILYSMWGLKKEWEDAYDGWKDGLFSELDVGSMEMAAQLYSKRVFKIGRDCKTWTVWIKLKETIDSFKQTLPLTVDLRNPAMRKRHWDKLIEHVGQFFDPTSREFTLAKVSELRLDLHVEFVCDLSIAASKELAIEEALTEIKQVWAVQELDMICEKGIWKLKGTEELFLVLEDNRVILSSMRSNRFHLHFAVDINKWDKDLALLSETIEMIIQVQRAWAYLESIFVGSEDIRKQLPQETKMFEGVNDTFIACMLDLHTVMNAHKAICKPGLLDTFLKMDKTLEKIQKSLDNYLELKRQQFPRFYFLSNENLLDILGQAKDPRNVQAHLKKCFEGIKKLEMIAPKEGRKAYETTGIFSPDGEYLPLSAPVLLDARPEEWLNWVEDAMRLAVKVILFRCFEESKSPKKDKWVKDFPGQCGITAGQMKWTIDCEKALELAAAGSKNATKKLYKKWISYLNKLTAMTRVKLHVIDRNKVTSLITIEVHARDVIEKLIRVACSSPESFEWSSQLRFYWEDNTCTIKQVLSVFIYGWEYQGNNGRLVITPLTDRCYITLGAALFTRRGGNPLGPAGTGKTETVKDFGKALARYVIVFNCSDGVDYKMTGTMFSGLSQTGAWACLDEFNRIEVEVLSVVASQISAVMQAIKAGLDRYVFEGVEMRLIRTCGIFVTMNPGYAGRSELPENLKAMLRPVSMMLPDFTLIAENMLFSEGFQTAKLLAKKVIAIMELSQRQLSKQDHYDYGLRSFVIPIARAAGSMKRVEPDLPEDVILQRAMRDLIKPKLIFADLPLFNALLSDLFPGVELAPKEADNLKRAIEHQLRLAGMQIVPAYITKIIQTYDCMIYRHGNMLVGRTGSGKTVGWRALQNAWGQLKDEGLEGWQKVWVYIMNSLALSNDEIYGCTSKLTGEWVDGVLARIMRDICAEETPDLKWVMFDGPVDTLWIESMNTLLDDNKILTLLNGERINMPGQIALMFEVEDLSQASPATVSRAGMIFLTLEDLGWWPYAESWIERRTANGTHATILDQIRKLLEKYIDSSTNVRHKCYETIPIEVLNSVMTLSKLFDLLAIRENGVHPGEGEFFIPMIETWFLFCLIWSVGASVDEAGRNTFDMWLRDQDPRFPASGLVYDYFVDFKKHTFALWEEKLTAKFIVPAGAPFFKIQVPTIDTIRFNYVIKNLILAKRHTLVVGNVGVGKTLVIGTVVTSLPEGLASFTMNFSAQTSSNSCQEGIEGRLEKRTKGVFAPPGGKFLICFLDDVNMPKKSVFGFMPPLELLKLWMDNGFWYDRMKQEVKKILNMQLLCAMAPPGGGRNRISQRIQACFSLLNITAPNDKQMKRIFGAILSAKLADFENEVRLLGDNLMHVCIAVYLEIVKELLPTPSKSHYVFNMRDLAKVIQGILQGHKDTYHTKDSILRLFIHECLRVYGDRMWDPVDRQWLKDLLNTKLKDHFNSEWKAVFGHDKNMPLISSCMMPPIDDARYESIESYKELRESLEENLRELKTQPGSFGMNLVLFKDAMDHICRIHRVIMQPRGNLLLVGVGGSGRKSLTKLSAFVADMKIFQVKITRSYFSQQFHDDLKLLFHAAGIGENKQQVVFLFDDTQVVEETFLEDINNILSTGEVPNLFTKDDLSAVFDGIRPTAKNAGIMETEDALWAFFVERVRNNLHVVLCLSPVSELFSRRLMMFPGLVNCSTIDWFLDWPEDALSEVSVKLLEEEENCGNPEAKLNICKVFVVIHKSVVDMSAKMYQQVKRKNYVTPTSYLEFAKGYRGLLKEKRDQLQNQASKLRGGLSTLNATREQVAEMQIVCQDKAVVVAGAKKECEEILVEIVTEKRVVDEQEVKVNAEAARIMIEADKCNIIAADCQVELDKAMPALMAAESALNVLTKKDMSEVKAYAKPPALVEMTLQAVMTVLKRPPIWAEAKLALGDSQFLDKLMNYNKDYLNDAVLNKIGKFTKKPEFTPEAIGKVSGACKGLCLWVRAMESYGYIAKEVAPKKASLKAAQDNLARQEASLARARAQLAEIMQKVQNLKDKYDKSINAKAELEAELDDLNVELFRAEKLVSGLAGEKERWEASIINLEEGTRKLPGDCLIAAAFLSYAGPFATEYRDEIVNQVWMAEVLRFEIPSTPGFTFVTFLSDAGDVREWNLQGLPADAFSTENGVMVTRSNRWPLMIDPQEQAKKWVKNMEGPKGLEVVDLQMDNLMSIVENAIQNGLPVLLQDVMEEIDPSLEPVLTKAFVIRSGQVYLNLGDKELDYNANFRLYITTKLGNPHFAPEIATKTTIINFSVKEDSLEKQLLTIVVQKERPDLDKQRNELIITVSTGKKTQAACEDNILRLLITAEGPLLDNLELISTLDTSKETWEKVKESLEVAEVTARKIESASSAYKPCAERASLLYFILIELVAIDPMYQFSLESYTELFLISIAKSAKSEKISERIKNLIEYHTYAVYKYTTRGLFEKHKLLLSLQILSKILQLSGEISTDEWNFFLKGAIVLDRTKQPPNPAPLWIKEEAWDNINGLALVSPFEGIVASMTQDVSKWQEWFKYSEPEENELPGEWEEKCSELQRMMLLRCFRLDRVIFACTAFVSNILGQKFVEPPMLDLGDSLNDSVPHSPLLFILSAGVDPTSGLRQFAGQKNMLDRFHTVALGQGQGPVAVKHINEAAKHGGWVFLANCQLMTSWLPKLEKIIQTLEKSSPSPEFRLWLSSVPNDKFPIGILQRSVKMTAEPPKGLRANILRLYTATTEESFYKCKAQEKYQKLHFALAYFHSVLLERRKFGTLGLNIPYDFNDTDFEVTLSFKFTSITAMLDSAIDANQVSNDLLTTYLDEYEETPFDALKFLISEANYGGRVTDEIDRRVLAAYLNQFYCPAILSTPNYELSSLSVYHVPDDGTLQTHREFIKTLPATDRPEAFGQHANADIAFQLSDSRLILMTIASLQKSTGGSKGGVSIEETVLGICQDLLVQVPEPFDLPEVQKQKAFDPSALHTILFQEIERYNILLRSIREQCTMLGKGIQGLITMSIDLQVMFDAFARAQVPAIWVKAYPTMKPLGSWTRDLVMRITELKCWVEGTYPMVYWLAGFTYPADFLTAVLQTTARRNLIPIDTLVWEFATIYKDEMDIVEQPKEGIYVKGCYLEGAGWDPVNDCLCEPKPMELIVPMPIILFKPAVNKKKQPKGLYNCPLFLYPIRTGTRERPSYMLMIHLKVGAQDSDYWVKRGTALLLALAN